MVLLVSVAMILAILSIAGIASAQKCHSCKPLIKNLSPKPGSFITDITPTIGATVKDRKTDLRMSNIKLYLDGSEITDISYNRRTNRLSYTTGTLSRETHTATITVSRRGRIMSQKSWSFSTECTIVGTKANDVLEGTAGDDVICGLGGKDVIKGLGGNDILEGGDDNDTALVGGEGDDTIVGGNGRDRASFADSAQGVKASLVDGTATGEGNDQLSEVENLFGSPFDDELTGSDNFNRLFGDLGNDTLWGLGGRDSLFGWGGQDSLHGGLESDIKLVGGSGADEIFGDNGNDSLNSQDGVNGNDSLDGGAGIDTAVKDATEASIVNIP
jgi:Ca2+-binding RTX toxin-like protein